MAKDDSKKTKASSEDRYLSAKQVRQRYGGKSDMTLWRWSRDPDLRFPKHITIRRQRFWRESELEAWEQGLR